MKLGKAVSWLMGTLQRSLFPHLEECWQRPLTEKEQRLVTILEITQVQKYVARSASTQWLGRKTLVREAIARSFVAKAVYGHPFTRTTIHELKTTPNLLRICGFKKISDIPSEATFSRAFAEFAGSALGDRVHEALVERCLRPELVGHISRDSTAIKGREKAMAAVGSKSRKAPEPGRPALFSFRWLS